MEIEEGVWEKLIANDVWIPGVDLYCMGWKMRVRSGDIADYLRYLIGEGLVEANLESSWADYYRLTAKARAAVEAGVLLSYGDLISPDPLKKTLLKMWLQ